MNKERIAVPGLLNNMMNMTDAVLKEQPTWTRQRARKAVVSPAVYMTSRGIGNVAPDTKEKYLKALAPFVTLSVTEDKMAARKILKQKNLI